METIRYRVARAEISYNRHHDPAMFIMARGDNPEDDANFEFVDYASAYYVETGKDGRVKAYYHIGVTSSGEIICDEASDVIALSDLKPCPKESIPEEAKLTAIIEGAKLLPFEAGFRLLEAFKVTSPENLEMITEEHLQKIDQDPSSEEAIRIKEIIHLGKELGEQLIESLQAA